MLAYQKAFIEFAIAQNVLSFGEFKLKSGRISPYFFNAGLFNSGKALAKLGEFYAQACAHQGLEFDMLFGPAYKGIPLASSLSVALYQQFARDVPYAFNRKEQKTHGEGGMLVGAKLSGKLLLVDDVITAGTAIREIMHLLVDYPDAKANAVLVALDRQEKGLHDLSAIAEVQRDFNLPVVAVVNLAQIIDYLQTQSSFKQQAYAVQAYRERYGV